jgi:hypothetical protein
MTPSPLITTQKKKLKAHLQKFIKSSKNIDDIQEMRQILLETCVDTEDEEQKLKLLKYLSICGILIITLMSIQTTYGGGDFTSLNLSAPQKKTTYVEVSEKLVALLKELIGSASSFRK